MAEPVIRDGKQVLRNDSGDLVQVSPGDAAKFLADGTLHPVDAAEVAQADRQADMQTPGRMLETAAFSAGEAIEAPLEWGLNKLGVLPEFHGNELWQREKEQQELNPGSALTGQLASSIIGAKGLGLGRLAGAAGEAASGLGRVGQAAIATGVEGAGYGAQGAMIEDPNASAQHVMAAGGMGFLLGGGLGAATSATGGALSRIFGRSENPLINAATEAAEAATAEAETKPVTSLEKILSSTARAGSNVPEDLMKEVGPGGAKMREAIEAADHFETYVNDTAKELTRLSNIANEAVEDVNLNVRSRSLKEAGIRKLIEPAMDTEPRRAAANAVIGGTYEEFNKAISGLTDLAEEEGVGLPRKTKVALNSTSRLLESTMKEMANPDLDLAQRFTAANVIKAQLDDLTKALRKDSISQSVGYNELERNALRETATKIEEVVGAKTGDDTFGGLRGALESPKIWGEKAASAQKEVNRILHGNGIDAKRAYGREFMRDTGRDDWQTQRDIFEVDPRKIASFLNDPSHVSNEIPRRTFEQYIERMRALTETIGDKYESGPQAQKALKALDEMQSLYEKAKGRADLANKWRELETYKPTGRTARAAQAIGALPFMGGIGRAIGAAATPAEAGRLIDAITSKAQAQTQRSLIDSVGSWIRGGAKAVVTQAERLPGKSAATSAAVSHFRANHENDDAATDARLQALRKADPSVLGQHLEGASDAVIFHAGAVANNAINYLRSQLPPYLSGPTFLQSTRKAVMSQADQIKFGRIWGTVTRPETAVVDLKQGRLTPSQADALQAVYPSVYDDIRNEAIRSIGVADATGKRIPIDVRNQLSILLKLDGAGEPALSDAFSERIQNLLNKSAQQKPPPQRQLPQIASKVADSRKSPFQLATAEV